MTLTEAIDSLVKDSFDAQKTWKGTLENQPLGESMLSMRMLFDLLDKDICNQIITLSKTTGESSVHNFAISLFAKNFGTENVSNVHENILVSHIELIIQSLIKNGKIGEINPVAQKKEIHFAEDLQTAITQLIKTQGTEALKNTHRVKAMLPDLTGGKFKNEISEFCSFMEQLNSGNEFTDKETAKRFLSIIETACTENSLEIPSAIIDAKEKVNVVIPKETVTTENDVTDAQPTNGTELFSAIENADIEKINTLIDNGTDVNARDENGYTPLMFAAVKGDANIANLLISEGADINRADMKNGWTALVYAIRTKSIDVVKLLLNKGAEVNKVDLHNWSPIMRAVVINSAPITQMLLDCGADISETLPNGQTLSSLADIYQAHEAMSILNETLAKNKHVDAQTENTTTENDTVESQTDSGTEASTESDNSSASASSTQTSTNDGWAELVKEKEAHKKTKINFWIFLVLFIIVGICVLYFGTQYDSYRSSYYWQSRQIADLQTENKNLQDENKKLKSDYYTLDARNQNTNSNAANVNADYRNLQNNYSNLQNNYSNLEKRHSDLNKQYNDSFNNPVAVKITRVYNLANNSTNLIRSEITWLNFDYTVFKLSSVNLNEKLYVKVINPDGTLRDAPNSPNGYSFTVDINSTSTGWGNATPGNYSTRGNYTIEFWYQSVCVGRKVVNIN